MSIRDLTPIVIYDDRCYLCSRFASIVHIFAKNKILIVGHYSDVGMRIKSEVFKEEYDSTIMFWFITRKTAYGGRAAILPLLQSILMSKSRAKLEYSPSMNCTKECRTSRALFTRTKSLLSNSEKIPLKI